MFICNFHPDRKKCLFDGTRIASYCTTGKREVLQCLNRVKYGKKGIWHTVSFIEEIENIYVISFRH